MQSLVEVSMEQVLKTAHFFKASKKKNLIVSLSERPHAIECEAVS